MAVNIEWKLEDDAALVGIIAEDTLLWSAAKRLGVRLPAECEGRGECDTCSVVIEKGATLLSALTDAERTQLSPERLAAGERLACQTQVKQGGEIVVKAVPRTLRSETTEESTRDFRKEFREMPLKKKMSTLVEFEAIAAYHTLVKLADLPFQVIGKGLDLMAGRGRALSQRDREARKPSVNSNPTKADDKAQN